MQTDKQTDRQTHTHRHTETQTHIDTHWHTLTHIDTHWHTLTHIDTHWHYITLPYITLHYIHTYTHTHTNTHTYTNTHKYTHTHTHKHTHTHTHLTDRLSSMSHFLFPIRGIWIFQFKAFFSKKHETVPFGRTAKPDSVVYILMRNSLSLKRNEMTEKQQVRGVDQTPHLSLLHGASLATAMQRLCCPLLLVTS